ncbi:MAG: AraC family transcriptional regulator [Bacteroidales bacterium]
MKRYKFKPQRPFEFELKELSEVTQQYNSISGVPHRTDFYEIILIESGESTQMVDFTPIKLKRGDILFIGKNQVAKFDSSETYNGKIILFTDQFFNRGDRENQLMQLFNPFNGATTINLNEKLSIIFELIEKEYNSHFDKHQSEILHAQLKSLLLESSRQREIETETIKSPDHSIALEFYRLVEDNYHSIRKVNDYIKMISISPKQLSKAINSTIGKTPKQYIDDRVTLEAKRLLVYSDLNIKEISYKLGFEEPTNFSKFFKEQKGITPAEFRKLTPP